MTRLVRTLSIRLCANVDVYKRQVYWCPHCETALAEAEIEYGEQKTPTIFVKMPLVKDNGQTPEAAKGKKAYMVIWTTTPWTMPANVAVALNPALEYALSLIHISLYQL